MVLMTDNAVDRFKDNTSTWQRGAGAGLTVVNYSGAQSIVTAHPKADIVIWSGTKGLYGGISAGARSRTVIPRICARRRRRYHR